MRRNIREILVAAVLSFLASNARADIDVTGNWTTEHYDIYLLQMLRSSAVLSQSGTVLNWNGSTGVIDPVGGSFSVDSTVTIGPFPGLAVHTEGTFDPDGNRMSGTSTAWQFTHFMPASYTYEFRAIRDGVSVCGDETRDADEACDFGSIQQQCCSSGCEMIDPDGDGFCNEVDICPDEAYATTCGSAPPFSIRRLSSRVPNSMPDERTFKLLATVTGEEIKRISSIDELRIRELGATAGYEYLVNDLACTRVSDKRLDCSSPDGRRTVSVRSQRDGAKIKAIIGPAPASAPAFSPSIEVSFADNFGLVRTETTKQF